MPEHIKINHVERLLETLQAYLTNKALLNEEEKELLNQLNQQLKHKNNLTPNEALKREKLIDDIMDNHHSDDMVLSHTRNKLEELSQSKLQNKITS